MRSNVALVPLALCAALGQCFARLGDDAALLQAPASTEGMTESSSYHAEDPPSRIHRKAHRTPSWHDALLQHIESSKFAAQRIQAANKTGIPIPAIPVLTPRQIQASRQVMRIFFQQGVQRLDAAQDLMVEQMSQIYPFTKASETDQDHLKIVESFSCVNMSTSRRADFDEAMPLLQAVFLNLRDGYDNIYASLFDGSDLITNFYEHQLGTSIRDLTDDVSYLIHRTYDRIRLREELDSKHEYLNCILGNLTSAEFTPRTHLMREFFRNAWNCTMYLNYTSFVETQEYLDRREQTKDMLASDGTRMALQFLFGNEYYDQLVGSNTLLEDISRRSRMFGNMAAALLCDRQSRMDRVRRDIRCCKPQDE